MRGFSVLSTALLILDKTVRDGKYLPYGSQTQVQENKQNWWVILVCEYGYHLLRI